MNVFQGRPFRSLFLAVSLAVVPMAASADSTAQTLPFSQNWSNTGLITTSDSWAGVPGIIGYRGDNLASTGANATTITADDTGLVVDVNANQTNPNTFTTGGVSEFHITDPVVALQGSGTADAPYLLLHLNTTGAASINVTFNARDIDGSSDNAAQQLNVQYRVGSSGTWTNVTNGYYADVTTGPSLATSVTAVAVVLPSAADNQPLVQVRILTVDASGSDEWVGIDDISVASGATDSAPNVSSTSPSDNAVNVAVGSDVTVTFTEDVAASASSFSISCSTTGAHTFVLSGGPQTWTLNPDTDFTRGETCTVTVVASTVTDTDFIDPPDTMAANYVFDFATDPPLVAIHDVQGDGSLSPYAGQNVEIQGVVTAVKFNNGFFVQAADADANPLTSEGIFVFTSSAPTSVATVGNLVSVKGTVAEFSPGSDPNQVPLTEITGPTYSTISTGNPLPAAVAITAADMPSTGGMEVLERLEGMRVSVAQLTVTAPTGGGSPAPKYLSSTSNGVFQGVIPGADLPFREPGIDIHEDVPPGAGASVPRFDANPQRLRVDSDGQKGVTTKIEVMVGNTVENLVGVLDYGFRTWSILPDAPPTVVGTLAGTAVRNPIPSEEFTVGHYNLQRFFDDVDDPALSSGNEPVLTTSEFDQRLGKASLGIRSFMKSPDIVGVIEIEGLNALTELAERVNADTVAAGGANPGYVAYLEEGNDIGGIDVGFLVKSSRVTVYSVEQLGKDYLWNDPVNGITELNDRPPLKLTAGVTRDGVATPYPVTVIVVHQRSLGSIEDTGSSGDRTREKRRLQAEYLAGEVQAIQNASPSQPIVVLGDFNAFEFNDGYVDVMGISTGEPAPAD